MYCRTSSIGVWFLLAGSLATCSLAADVAQPPTLKTVEPPAAISRDEPLSKSFSLEKVAESMDRAALDWQATHNCAACHTMMPYMMARPALSAIAPQSAEVRAFFEEIAAGKREAMPAYECDDAEAAVAIGVAASLSLNDRGTTGKLHPLTRQALDQMWKLQRPDGGWVWPFRDTPPLKVSEHYGVVLAAIAVGMAPEGYAQTPAAKSGLDGIRKFLGKTPAVTLHEQVMLLWASAYVTDLVSEEGKTKTLAKLIAAQRPDGGWSLASLADNTSDPALQDSKEAVSIKAESGYGDTFMAYVGRDKVYKSSLASDGYATGLATYVALQAGVKKSDAHIQRGVEWLKTHQRASGRWYTPSQAWHSEDLISNAGTAYAVLALEACGEVAAKVKK